MWFGKQKMMHELERLLHNECNPSRLLSLALLISATSGRQPDIGGIAAFTREQAARVKSLCQDPGNLPEAIEALNQVFFKECGFQPSPAHAYHPHYSDLSEVLVRRIGIPISLGLVYIDIGQQAGLPLFGINFPGHFLAGVYLEGQNLPIDVYNGGQLLSVEACEKRLQALYGDSLHFEGSMLQAASQRAILVRVLNNLKGYYIQAGQENFAAEMIDRILMIDPRRYTEYRDRGLLLYNSGRAQEAVADFEQYLRYVPDAPDALMLQSLMLEILEERPPLH